MNAYVHDSIARRSRHTVKLFPVAPIDVKTGPADVEHIDST